MKKLSTLMLVFLVGTLAWAGEMTLRIPEAGAPSRTVWAEGDDTIYLVADTAYCYHAFENAQPDKDNPDTMRYYMMLTLANYASGSVASVQMHMMALDTMTITADDVTLFKVVYIPDGVTQNKAAGGKFAIYFLGYDTIGNWVRPQYLVRDRILFADHAPVVCTYHGPIDFYRFSNTTKAKTPYVPVNEVIAEDIPGWNPNPDDGDALDQLNSTSGRFEKVMINGQLLIMQLSPDGRILEKYDFTGRKQ